MKDSLYQDPGNYHRRVLVAVTGLSPQVVTETLYALTQNAKEQFVPTEVHLITTAEGAERARLALLSEDPGWFQRLLDDYRLPPMQFDLDNIHALHSKGAVALDDIRTPEDNERAADLITEKIRDLSSDPSVALHVSIAGGRKTMGFYAGYALSLFGRPQDRLSHVLVSPRYESHPDFFYPTPYNRVIHTPPPDSRPLDTKDAEVNLAEIPFVSMRHGLPDELLNGRARFSETVAAARRALGPPRLEIDLDGRRIRAGGVVVRLPPSLLAFYSWFARRRLADGAEVACPMEGVPEPEYAREYLQEYRLTIGEMGDDERTAGRLSEGMDKEFFVQTKSKLRGELRRALGSAAAVYAIKDQGIRPKRFRLVLDPKAIEYRTVD